MEQLNRIFPVLRRLNGPRAGALAAAGMVGILGLNGLVGADDPVETTGAEAATEVVADAASPAASVELSELKAGMHTDDWDLPNLDHPRVEFWVDRFQTDRDMRKKFEGFLERSGLYRDMIARKLAERDMPQDLIYLAMIESGFQAHAYSHAAASGLWQFISETGQRYGLRVDREIDERNDPEKATDAALDYLTDLHDRFNSWYLASAAYNTGENRVGRIMREETGSERARSEQDYYKIWDRLPRETRDYVPLMIAAGRIAKDPARYGFAHVRPQEPIEAEVVVTDAELTLAEVAKAAGTEVDVVKLLNPQFKSGRLPRGERVALRLPVGTKDAFESSWADLVPEGGFEPTLYQVRRGDNLTTIARRHGVSVSTLRQANGLRGSRIYEGQTLRIETR